MEYIAFDAHKHYTLASVSKPDGQVVREERIEHDRGSLREFLERCERGSPVAVETIGNWYWIVDEIETAGCVPKPQAGARAQGEADDGGDQQDRYARRAGAQPAAAERHAAHGLDSARRIAGPARPAAHPDGTRPPAHAAQESDSRHLGQVYPPRPRGDEFAAAMSDLLELWAIRHPTKRSTGMVRIRGWARRRARPPQPSFPPDELARPGGLDRGDRRGPLADELPSYRLADAIIATPRRTSWGLSSGQPMSRRRPCRATGEQAYRSSKRSWASKCTAV